MPEAFDRTKLAWRTFASELIFEGLWNHSIKTIKLKDKRQRSW